MVVQQNAACEYSSAETRSASRNEIATLLWWLSDAASHLEHTPYTLFGLRNGEKDPRLILSVTAREHDRAFSILAWRHEVFAESGLDAHGIVQAAINWITTPHLKNILDAHLKRTEALKRLLKSGEINTLPDYVPCAECSTVNTSGHKFCSSCGRHLWDICYECGAFGRACDAFCGCCGKSKRVVLETWRQHGLSNLDNAASAWSGGRKKVALDLWYSLATSHDWRLHTFSLQAAEQWLEHHAEWLKCKVLQDEVLQRAIEAGKAGNWQQQLTYLNQIDDEFLSPDLLSLRHQLRERLSAAQQLSSQLQKAFADKRWLACCRYVDRILELDPHNESAARIRDTLVDKLCDIITSLLKKGKIRQAKQLFDSSPRTARSQRFSELHRKTDDLLWLQKYIDRYPVADKRLLELCRIAAKANLDGAKERLASLVPLLHTHSAKRTPQPPPAPWFRKPSHTCFGIPVAILRQLPGIIWDSPETADLSDLTTACALAAQGLGAGRFQSTLYVDTPPSILSWRRGRAPAAWGLELSAPVCRVVRLERTTDQQFRVTHVLRIPSGSQLQTPTSNCDYSQVLTQLLEHISSRTTEPLVVACPQVGMFWKRLTLPTVRPAELNNMIHYETKLHVPLPVDEVYSCFHILANREESQQTEGVLCAIKRSPIRPILDQLRQLFPRCTLVLQAAPFALANILSQLLGASGTCPAAAVVDVDYLHSNFVLLSQGQFWHRALRFCGEKVVSRLVASEHITREQAKHVLFQQDAIPQTINQLRILEEEFFSLCREIQESFEGATKEEKFLIERLYVTGGSASMNGLFRALLHGPITENNTTFVAAEQS